MTLPREEYLAAVEQLEEALTQAALVLQCLRRLEQDLLWSDPEAAEEMQDTGQT